MNEYASNDERPRENVIYRHIPTDDIVEYLTRDDDHYMFRINRNRTLELRTEDWEDYREHLKIDREN